MTFSTPDRSLPEILSLAQRYGYDGIELRLDSGHAHGVEVTSDAGARAETRRRIGESGIALCCISTSCTFADPAERDSQVDAAVRRIDLASDLGAPRLRVFGGQIPRGTARE